MILIYCELAENGHIADVSLELCTKGRSLANELGTQLAALVCGSGLGTIEQHLYPFGVDQVFKADDKRLSPYRTLPHFAVLSKVIEENCPDVVLMGATCVGRDLTPRISSYLRCGLTADCTSLEIGPYEDKVTKKQYDKILYQIRPAFGGNIIATIVNPETRPQMATVREGVMKKEVVDANYKGTVTSLDANKYLRGEDECVKIIAREIEQQKINIKNSSIIVSGGYGMGSKENFEMLHQLAQALGGEVGATRAAVDAGFAEGDRQIGQTGVTVRPKLYIACGISGAVQHRAGMDQSGKIISINTDPEAPINAIADYTIIGDVCKVVPQLIACYNKNKK
ncbi:MAG: electron transfer flavoprotein subunit alpha/FixB family protein [Bacteroidales bacterium]|nr:electron transfer flavoprotein subunit alpha/FixB family protein [Bacteroidales bacterium]